MFHSSDGLYFEKLPDGGVRILKRSGSQEDSPVIFDHVLDANQWASVIASMSLHGEEDGGFYYALQFHRGDPLPVGVRLADEPGVLPPIVD